MTDRKTAREELPMIEVRDVTMRFNLAKEKTDTIKEYFLKGFRSDIIETYLGIKP